MTKKWLTLMSGSGLIGYVKVGTKVGDISTAMKEANEKIKAVAVKPTKAPVTKKVVVKPSVKKAVAINEALSNIPDNDASLKKTKVKVKK